MNYKITYLLDDDLPKLGWIIVVDVGKKHILARHGKFVECHEEWMVEGVWDQPFKQGNFHNTEVFFGSGMRVVGDSIHFITSSALTDRIVLCEDKEYILISNSLVLLLAYTGAKLDDEHDYRRETLSIIQDGVANYHRRFKIIHPSIECFYQVFYENIVLENGKVTFAFKPKDIDRLKTYEAYYGLLNDKVKKLTENYKSEDRSFPIKPYTTISAGYDSAAVSCIVKNHGVQDCFTGSPLNRLLLPSKKEGGIEIGRSLGFAVRELDSSRKRIPTDELYFLATNYPKFSNSVWLEISLHSMVEEIERQNRPAVVFFGYSGENMWDVNMEKRYQTNDLKTGSPISGLNLSEIRLVKGFFNVALPYIYARGRMDVLKISRSKAMEKWKLDTAYDRPIPRRIVESAGIDRYMFGMKKMHITTTYMWPFNKDNRKNYFAYLRHKKRLSKWYVFAFYFQKRILLNIFNMKKIFGHEIDFYDLMRKWATEVLTTKYSALQKKRESDLKT